MVANEVRVVCVHVGELHLDHQLDVLLALLLLLAQEAHEQAFHLIPQSRVAVHLQRKEKEGPSLHLSECSTTSCKGDSSVDCASEGSTHGRMLSA